MISPYVFPGMQMNNRKYIINDIDMFHHALVRSIKKVTGITIDDIRSKNRHKEIVRARQMYCYIMMTETKIGQSQLARKIHRNHASVYHAVKKIKHEMKHYDDTKGYYTSIMRVLIYKTYDNPWVEE